MRYRSYILFCFVVVLLQVFVLNNVTITPLLAPTLYIVCVAMMPIEWSQLRMLISTLLLAVAMDFTMGVVGLNVIATLPVSFFRRPIMHVMAGVSDLSKEEGIPSVRRLGRHFHRYFLALVVMHGLLFFGFEALSFHNLTYLAMRLGCSMVATLLLSYFMLLLFNNKLSGK